MSALFLKAVLAFAALPGIVAFVVPVTVFLPRPLLLDRLGAVPLLLGVTLLLSTVREFYLAGRGTLAPFDPPRRLVASGLYRFTRNPMYNGVLLVLAAEAWLFRSAALLEYAILMFTVFSLAVFLYEEPMLESQFGESYRAYRRAVPRWGFTTRPFHQDRSNTGRPT